MTDKSSYQISSQPKIQDIDYVTYVLGPLGTWFEFSFIGIDPVRKLMSVKGKCAKVNEGNMIDKLTKENS